jgi:flagellar hook-associated protein 1 FlgK
MSLINSLISARSGLRAANAGVNATSNNVANSATKGYNRRNVNQSTADPTQRGRLNYGNGANVTAIGRSTDNMLNMRRLKEAGDAVSSETEYYQLTSIERLFDETQGTTVRGELSAFFDSLSLATADPSDVGLRKQVGHTANRLAESISRTATSIDEGREMYEKNIDASLISINNQFKEIADLNAKIMGAGGAMGAGDLADRRDQVIRDLAEKVGVTADLTADGQATVYMGGHAIVSKSEARTLSLDGGPPIALTVNSGGGQIDVSDSTGGELGGYLSAYNKASDYIDRLNTFSEDFSAAMNAQHATGFDRSGTAGADLFTFTPGTAAKTMKFSDAIMEDVDLLAFAGAASGEAGDSGNLVAMLDLQDVDIIDGGSAKAQNYIVELATALGNDVAEADRAAHTQHAVLDDLDELYQNLHGVDMDEEAANLVMYQSAYQASAKVISVTNDLMNNIMNLV